MHRDHQENKCDDQENNETRHIFVVKIFLLGNFCRLRRWCGSDLTTLTQCLNQDIDFHGRSLPFVVHVVALASATHVKRLPIKDVFENSVAHISAGPYAEAMVVRACPYDGKRIFKMPDLV